MQPDPMDYRFCANERHPNLLTRIQSWLKPPDFPADEEKTRQARVLYALLQNGLIILVVYAGIVIPFFFVEKWLNLLGALLLLGMVCVSFVLLRAGRVVLAASLFSAALWIGFTLYLILAGGVNTVIAVAYIAGTVITGLLLGIRPAILYGIASSAVSLAVTLLQESGTALPRLFPVPPLVTWVDLTIFLWITVTALNLMLTSLQDALALTKKRLAERITAEQALRESEERFANLAMMTLEGIAVSADGRIIDANPQLAVMLWYPVEELIGMQLVDLAAPEFRPLVQEYLDADFEGSYELLARRKDGSTFPVEIRVRLTKHNGQRARVSVVRDISVRKQEEIASERQLERLRALYGIEQAILSSMDLNRILTLLVREVVNQLHVDAVSVLMVNPQSGRLEFAAREGFRTEALRYTHLEIGQGLAGLAAQELKMVHIANLETVENPVLLQSITGEGFLTYYGVPLVAKEQLYGVMELFHRSPLAPDPEWLTTLETLAAQAAISIHNASLLEATQQSLKETNALYRISQRLAGSLDPDQLMKDVVDILHRDFGFYHAQIFQLDPASDHLVLSHGSGEIGGKLREEGFRLRLGLGIVGHVAETGKPFTTNDVEQVVFFVRNPYLPDVQSEMAVPIKIEGQVLGVLDIQQTAPSQLTDRQMKLMEAVAEQLAVALQKATLYTKLENALNQEKAMRRQLIQSERLALVGRLLASVSHELNNPIQAIQNALFLIKEEEALSEQGRQDLEIVLAETGRMAALLDRLRATYRPTPTDDFQEIQLNDLIRSVQTLTATQMRHNNIQFEFQADPALPPVFGVPEQLRQVVLNLIMNAIEAMHTGGRLTVRSERLPRKKKVLLTISDTGGGIEPHILPRIFEPFITSKEKGTGLGLTITYDIIQQHRGEIQAENNPQGGATFRVWLPISRKE